VHGSHVEDYRRAPRGGLTTRCHGYIIGDKSDEGQDASLRVEMGNVGSYNELDTVIFWSVGVEIRRETSQNPGWLAKANF